MFDRFVSNFLPKRSHSVPVSEAQPQGTERDAKASAEQSRAKDISKPPVALLASIGFFAVSSIYALWPINQGFGGSESAVAVTMPDIPMEPPAEISPPPASDSAEGPILPDGVYLYGQSPEPEQLGQAYFVFEVRGGELIGAFYMPRSSFDCVYGSVKPQQLALMVVNSYDRTAYSYSLQRQDYTVASASDNPTSLNIGLEGFHPISTVSDNDRRVLGMCADNYREQVWGQ